jgi:hypothetical protein
MIELIPGFGRRDMRSGYSAFGDVDPQVNIGSYTRRFIETSTLCSSHSTF